MANNFVRWGVLGAANFARKQMAPAIHAASNGCLAAIASSSRDRVIPFTEMVPELTVYSDYEELLQSPDIDAVYIPLPNHLHVEWSIKALQAGKHVLCEKPVALNATDIETLISEREGSGLLLAEAFMIAHHPQWHYARQLLQSGQIGELQHIESIFTYYKNDPENIRSKPETGGGSIRDIGIYNFGCARFLTGEEPTAIRHTNLETENGIDTYAQVLAAFPSFHLSAISSMRIAEHQAVCIHGTDGRIQLTAPFNPGIYNDGKVELHKAGMETISKRFTGANQYVNQVENFNHSVLHDSAYPCPLEFSLGTQRMMDLVFTHWQDSKD